MSRNSQKNVPKQILKLIAGMSTETYRYLTDGLLEDSASVIIYGSFVGTKEIYVVYHSSLLNRLLWESIPIEVTKGYEVRGSCLRLVDFMNFDIPNKSDKLTLILILHKDYNFETLKYTAKATIYMPRKKQTFKRITTTYFNKGDQNTV